MGLLEINKKYSELAVIDCCSACGNALKYAGRGFDETVIHLGMEDKNFFDPDILTNYSSESADLIIADCMLFQVTDKQAIWNEIFRILKKGGRFIVSDLYAADSENRISGNSPVTRHEYLNMLEKAGFSILTIHEESPLVLREEGLVATWIIAGEKPLAECDWCI